MINRVVDQQYSSLIHYPSFARVYSHMDIWQRNSYAAKTHRNKSSLILFPKHKHTPLTAVLCRRQICSYII